MIFCCLLIFISKLTFAKNSYRKTISDHPCINQLGSRSVDEAETEKLSADDKRFPEAYRVYNLDELGALPKVLGAL